MERDLALIRSKRAERERAAGVLKARIPVGGLENTYLEQPGAARETPTSVREFDKPKSDDVIMRDVSAAESHNLIHLETMSKNSILEKTISASQDNPRDTEGPKGLAISIEPNSEKATSSPNVDIKERNRDDFPEQRLETPTTANLRDTDFETMFNDTETAGGEDGTSFDLQFSADTNIGQELLNSSSFRTVPMSNGNLTNFNTASNKNINSLLPGLESYANAGDDFPMVDVAPAKTIPGSDSKANTAAVAISAPKSFGSAPIESSFDDLFSSNGFVEGSGDYDMTGEGNMADLADLDDWFKQDL